MPEELLVDVQSVNFSYGRRPVLKGVTMQVPRGRMVAIMGASGSGKTTLLRLIGGQLYAGSGTVSVAGENLRDLDAEGLYRLRRRTGMLFQFGALFTDMTVYENVAFPLREHTDLSPKTIEDLSRAKLEMAGLQPDSADKYPAALSGGMTTRAGLARAIALDPKALFLDEPTGALDPISAGSLDELMRSLRKVLRLSILIITHDPNTLVKVCDRVSLIAHRRVESGTLDELLKSSDPEIQAYFSGERVKAALAERG